MVSLYLDFFRYGRQHFVSKTAFPYWFLSDLFRTKQTLWTCKDFLRHAA